MRSASRSGCGVEVLSVLLAGAAPASCRGFLLHRDVHTAGERLEFALRMSSTKEAVRLPSGLDKGAAATGNGGFAPPGLSPAAGPRSGFIVERIAGIFRPSIDVLFDRHGHLRRAPGLILTGAESRWRGWAGRGWSRRGTDGRTGSCWCRCLRPRPSLAGGLNGLRLSFAQLQEPLANGDAGDACCGVFGDGE